MSLFDLVYHATAIVLLTLGTFVLIDNFRQKTNWVFSLWTFSASIWMLSLYWGFWMSLNSYWSATLISFRLAFMFSTLAISSMTVFFYYFPKITIRVRPVLIWIYLSFTLFLLVACLTPLIHTSLVIEDGIYVSDKLGSLYPLYTFDIVLNFFIGLFLAVRQYMNVSGIDRKKLALAGGGYFVFVFFAILTNVPVKLVH